jgi:beta-lysine 5,6-aminomutase alpha subunit
VDAATVRRARRLAGRVTAPVIAMARSHTTVSVERATLRLAGLSGADPERVPWVNHLVEASGQRRLEHGVASVGSARERDKSWLRISVL